MSKYDKLVTNAAGRIVPTIINGQPAVPYMGVGRNLSYLKSVFYDNKGFIPHYRIRSGDDDLFVNMIARKSNTAVLIGPGSFTISEPKKKFGQWVTQKKRHITTAKHYRFIHKFLLGSYSFILFCYYFLSVPAGSYTIYVHPLNPPTSPPPTTITFLHIPDTTYWLAVTIA